MSKESVKEILTKLANLSASELSDVIATADELHSNPEKRLDARGAEQLKALVEDFNALETARVSIPFKLNFDLEFNARIPRSWSKNHGKLWWSIDGENADITDNDSGPFRAAQLLNADSVIYDHDLLGESKKIPAIHSLEKAVDQFQNQLETTAKELEIDVSKLLTIVSDKASVARKNQTKKKTSKKLGLLGKKVTAKKVSK